MRRPRLFLLLLDQQRTVAKDAAEVEEMCKRMFQVAAAAGMKHKPTLKSILAKCHAPNSALGGKTMHCC